MKKYTVTYEVVIDAEDIEEAEELARKDEVKKKARLATIRGEEESLEMHYEKD